MADMQEVVAVVVGPPSRAEIDTRAPFKSVKEAVTLFGDRVFAGEAYASKIHKEMDEEKHKGGSSKLENVATELEETKESLLKGKQETMAMANSLSSLKEELERTKRELKELKLEREAEKPMMEFEIEDLKFVEEPRQNKNQDFQNKRYVAFANVPLSQVAMPTKTRPFLERHPSLKKKEKKKKQPLIPLIGGIFSRKKKTSQVPETRTP